MDDAAIVRLYWDRNEQAIPATAEKYGSYCTAIARNILGSPEDAEECVNDAYMLAWNAMPPHRPARLPPFLGRIARNTALDRYDYNTAQCRGALPAVLEELGECVSGAPLEEALDLRALGEAISDYLDTVSPAARRTFLWRYWYGDSLEDIARRYGYTTSKVKSLLHRTRKGLREHLTREGYAL